MRAVHQPLLALQPLTSLPPEQRRLVADLDHYQHVIFISTNAVRFGLDCFDDNWPQLPVGINWYAIGDATRQGLAARGLAPQAPVQRMDSEGLLALPALSDLRGDRVLIVKGEGGRQALRDALADRGAQVDELHCYRRVCPALPAGKLAEILLEQQVGTIMISSGEGLAKMLTLLSERETTKFRDIALIVPSSRVAAIAQRAGFSDITTAENAGDVAMLQALLNRRSGE